MRIGPRKTPIAAWVCVAVVGCAHVEAPRGGPDDREPPTVLATHPEPDAIVPNFRGAVVISFDERISEQGIEDAVMVSPRTSPASISHGRSDVRVELRLGWRPNTIYQVSISPEVRDLFGNPLAEPITLVFSTGPPIPETEATGTVIDRITGDPGAGVRVEAIRLADSLVYAVPTDAQGAFRLEKVPEGEYRVQAYEDLNRSRALDPFEPRDTTSVTITAGEPTQVTLRLLMPDSTAPVASSARIDSTTIVIDFDDYLDPEQEVDPSQISIAAPDGTPVSVDSAFIQDGRGTAGGFGGLPAAPPPPPAPVDPAAPPPAGQLPPATPAREGPLPSRSLVVTVASAESVSNSGEYSITLREIRNVNGLAGTSEVTVEVEEPAPEPVPPPAQ